MQNAGNVEGKCNVGSSFSKAVMLRICLTRRVIYCLFTCNLNLAEFCLEILITLKRSTIIAFTLSLIALLFCPLQDSRQS
jgi:hypothetical protein